MHTSDKMNNNTSRHVVRENVESIHMSNVGRQGQRKVRSQIKHTARHSDDPVELLNLDHEKALCNLAQMENAVESIRAAGFSAEAFHQIVETVRYVNHDVRHHVELEERLLLPLLEQHGFREAAALRHEHRELWSILNRLLSHVQDIEEGRIHGGSIPELLNECEYLIDVIRKQITKEKTLLFPMLQHQLTQAEYQQLSHDVSLSLVHSA